MRIKHDIVSSRRSGDKAARALWISATLLAIFCAGCGRQEEPVPRSTASESAPPDDIAGVESIPAPQTKGVSAVGRTHGGALQTLNAVRTAAQAGMDRIVFEFSDSGLPEWEVKYIDPKLVTDCGTGEHVSVAGNAWLQITFRGAQAHTESGLATSGQNRRVTDQIALRELVRTCDFEGEVTWVAGIMRENEYIPRVLAGPSRLVIDIAH